MLIAESGATKTAWRWILADGTIKSFRSTGFNPNVMSSDQIKKDLAQVMHTHVGEMQPASLYFYGAGLGEKEQLDLMVSLLKEALPFTRVAVSHDLLGAARSTGQKEGLVGILGTGSNSAYYLDGHILDQKGGLGYLFGDEGSGADLGKHLIKGLIEGRFSAKAKSFIEAQGGMSIVSLHRSIYQTPKPNVRLAQLAKFLSEIKDDPSIRDMIRERFLAFLDHSICLYPDYERLPLHMIGSIAYYFVDILEEAANERQIMQLRIIQDPIEALVAFHAANEMAVEEES